MLYTLDLDSLPLPAARRIGITDLPVRLLTDRILPFCKVRDMLSLGCANKFFALILSDGVFWRRRLAIDYNFTGSETNRTTGWKLIYLRLEKPRLFAWGYVRFCPVLLRGRLPICGSCTCLTITIQNDPPTCVREFSNDDPFGHPVAI